MTSPLDKQKRAQVGHNRGVDRAEVARVLPRAPTDGPPSGGGTTHAEVVVAFERPVAEGRTKRVSSRKRASCHTTCEFYVQKAIVWAGVNVVALDSGKCTDTRAQSCLVLSCAATLRDAALGGFSLAQLSEDPGDLHGRQGVR